MEFKSTLMKLKMVAVEPILFSYMMIIFMESNAIQELVFVKSCIQLNNPVNISDCSYELKQNLTESVEEAAMWSKYNNCCLFFCTFLSSLFVGSWSDRFGRKFPMLIPPIGSTFAAAVNCILSVYIKTHPAFFIISSVISGLSFGSVGIIATTFGYISDFTHEQSRSKRIVILESMLFTGGTTGIYIAGLFLKHVNYDTKVNSFAQLFIFEGIVSALIVNYIAFRIPKHTSDAQSLDSHTTGLFNLKHISDSLRTVFRFREGGRRTKVLLMLFSLFLIYFGSAVQTTLGYYFVKTLGWTFQEYTLFHSIQFGVEGLALLFGLPTLLYFCHVPDHIFAALGMISRIAGFVMFGLSYTVGMVYSCAALYMLSEFPVPALRSMLSKTVNADEKGKIFAFTASLQNLCYLLGSFILTTIFTEVSFKGLCFEVVAGLQGIALIIIIYLYFTRHEYVMVYETVVNDGSVTETSYVAPDENSIY
nr:proton-coupled folate transporter isoform X2 [Parasteatoda tepidariorum]